MTKSEFVRLIESGRKAFDKAQKKEEELFTALGNQFPDLDLETCPSDAESADNIKEAICCYMQYGEYDPESIWEELVQANAEF